MMRHKLRAASCFCSIAMAQAAYAQMEIVPTHPNGEVAIVVDFEVRPGMTQLFEQVFALSVRCSRLEPGNITFDILRVVDAENRYVLYEVWRSPAALEAHFAQPYTVALFAAFDEVLAQPITAGGLRFITDLAPAPRAAPVASGPSSDPACR